MSIIKVVRCPACGKTKLLRHRCRCGGHGRLPQEPSTAKRVAIAALWVLGFTTLLLLIITTLAFMLSPWWASFLMFGIMAFSILIQRAYNFEDKIEVHHTMLPPPFSWFTKLEMFFNFWQQDRPLWRAYYIASMLATVAWMIFGRQLGP